jgi:hypothetical protein
MHAGPASTPSLWPSRGVASEVPVWVSSGRWGSRRARVEHCQALRAEDVYGQLVCAGERFGPGCRLTLTWTPHQNSGASWDLKAEIVSSMYSTAVHPRAST